MYVGHIQEKKYIYKTVLNIFSIKTGNGYLLKFIFLYIKNVDYKLVNNKFWINWHQLNILKNFITNKYLLKILAIKHISIIKT